MSTKQWRGNLASYQSAASLVSLRIAELAPGETVLRSQIYINAYGGDDDPFLYSARCFPFALVTSISATGPMYSPFTDWAVSEDLQIMWRGMLWMGANGLIPNSTTEAYMQSTLEGVEGYTSHSQRVNRGTEPLYIWLVGQMDTTIATGGQLYAAMAAQCLVATPT